MMTHHFQAVWCLVKQSMGAIYTPVAVIAMRQYIITAYEPNLFKWNDDFKTRRSSD